MIQKTEAIAINYIKYSESSIILHAFTRDHGYQSFIVSGVRSKKARLGIALFQPFSHLELVFYQKPNRDLHRLNDAKILSANSDLFTSHSKKSIALFLCEVLNKVLNQDHSENNDLFNFMVSAINSLNSTPENFESFHLYFLQRLAQFLGIGTLGEEIFDQPLVEKPVIDLLQSTQVLEYIPCESSGEVRYECLELVLSHYKRHIDSLGEIKSLKVLRQVFH